MICSVTTGLIVEAIKKTFGAKTPTITAAIVSGVVGIAVPIGYLVIGGISITAQDIVYIVAMVVLTWLCSTLGYDTVKTAYSQIKK